MDATDFKYWADESTRSLALRTKRYLKSHGIASPDLSKQKGIRINRSTVIFPKSKKRMEEIKKDLEEKNRQRLESLREVEGDDVINLTCSDCEFFKAKHRVTTKKKKTTNCLATRKGSGYKVAKHDDPICNKFSQK